MHFKSNAKFWSYKKNAEATDLDKIHHRYLHSNEEFDFGEAKLRPSSEKVSRPLMTMFPKVFILYSYISCDVAQYFMALASEQMAKNVPEKSG